jgi:tetratricopeptide (TPR) repeat protein
MKRIVVLIALALCATPAFADPTPEEIQQAKTLFDEGTAAYKVANFERALTAYEAAHKLYPAPQFLFNIAQCHFQLQNWERAVFFFEGYLREVPDATNRSLVNELIGEARTNAATKKEADKRKLDLERERFELERRTKEREAREADERARLAVQTRPVDEPKPVYKKWWFWTVVGGAVAGATITAIAVSSDTTTVLPSGSLGTWDRR